MPPMLLIFCKLPHAICLCIAVSVRLTRHFPSDSDRSCRQTDNLYCGMTRGLQAPSFLCPSIGCLIRDYSCSIHILHVLISV